MGPTEFQVVLITAPDRDEAERLADVLVGERLAACVNIVTGVRSVYRWQGEVERGDEVLLVAKTARGCFERLERRVRAVHSYDVPEVIALDITAASADYARFLGEGIDRGGDQPTRKTPGGGTGG